MIGELTLLRDLVTGPANLGLAELGFPFVPLMARLGWQLLRNPSLLLPFVVLVILCLPMLQMRARDSSYVGLLVIRRSD